MGRLSDVSAEQSMSLDAGSRSAVVRQRLQEALEGRYALESEIARGGMATVYLARDLHHDRTVAVKLLDPQLTSSIAAERFLREIQITGRLQHPHILPLIESGKHSGLVYYVMPHVSGESLRERLAREPQMSVAEAVWIAREVADALAYAHALGIVHRDIKPENILLFNGHAVVADFGIARAIACCNTSHSEGITAVGLPIGTPAYMSPEQAEGSPDVDGRSDIYGLGCVLFEMLSGRPPFVARSPRIVMNLHVTTPPPSLAELRPGLTPALVAAVERAIAKDRAARFQSAKEFADLLQLLAASEVVTRATPPEGAPQVPRRRSHPAFARTPTDAGDRSGRYLVAAAVVAALALAATSLVPWWRADRPAARPAAAPSAAAPAASAPAPRYAGSIAVMPLADYSAGREAAYLSEGITEELIAQLAKIRGLKVISRTSVVALTGRGLTAPQIAESLGVRNVLEGSVQRSGDRIRITLQLIDARTDAHLWAESYDRSLKDVIALRQEIAGKVGAALAMAVPGLESPGGSHTEMSAAYEAYLKGRYWLARTSPEGLEQSIKGFEDAIRIDSTYAPAYAGLASALRQWVILGYRSGREPYATFRRAASMAERALALDSTLAAGYLARGLVRAYAWAPAQLARADLERALALTPNAQDTHLGYSIALVREGRWDEALAQAETGAQLDPLSPGVHGALAVTAFGGRRYELAIQENRHALNLEPNFVAGHAIEALSLVLLGRAAECLGLDLAGFPETRAICLHAAGRTAEAAALIDSVSAAYDRGGYQRIFQLGLVAAYHALRRDVPRSVQWLERAYELSPSGFELRAFNSGLFDPVRSDPRFRSAITRIHQRIAERVLQ